MTERLRILIYISNVFQTLEFLEKTLSDKNEPKSGNLLYDNVPVENILMYVVVSLVSDNVPIDNCVPGTRYLRTIWFCSTSWLIDVPGEAHYRSLEFSPFL